MVAEDAPPGHPKSAHSKSRVERVVDLYEPETLAMLSARQLSAI
ncbi:MAG TPA: hypothetical protein VGG87_00525 [Solirubrobacteraceae bacterium]